MTAEKKHCPDYREKLFFLEDLEDGERQEVERHVRECRECGRHLQEVGLIMNSLKERHQNAEHIDDALLIRYTTYLADSAEPDYDGRKLSRSEVKSVKQHLTTCRTCEQKASRYLREFKEIEQYTEAKIPAEVMLDSPLTDGVLERISTLVAEARDRLTQKLRAPVPKFSPILAGTIAAIVVMVWMGPFFRANENPYFDIAAVEGVPGSLLTRGTEAPAINEAGHALQQRNYEQAVSILENFIASKPEASRLYYAHYLLGVAQLSQAGSGFLGRFRSYDADEVNKGAEHLKTSLLLNDNSEVVEDIYWYLAKAYLMKGEAGMSQDMLTAIIGMRGRRFKDAKEMDKEIDSILQSTRK